MSVDTKPENPPAFPGLQTFETFDDDRGKYVEQHLPTGGMDLRDYFAAKAMPQAIKHHLSARAGTISPGRFDYALVAKTAYMMADAMLKTREAK